jgi:uncharacterized protein YxjI
MQWNDYYKIVRVDLMADDKNGIPTRSATSWMLDEEIRYEIHDPDGKVIAKYKDFQYAKKQAKYRFKKLQAKLEKILLA